MCVRLRVCLYLSYYISNIICKVFVCMYIIQTINQSLCSHLFSIFPCNNKVNYPDPNRKWGITKFLEFFKLFLSGSFPTANAIVSQEIIVVFCTETSAFSLKLKTRLSRELLPTSYRNVFWVLS